MTRKVTLTLENQILEYVDRQVARLEGATRSGFINSLLTRERDRALEAELEQAYRADAADLTYRQEAAMWDSVAADGLGA